MSDIIISPEENMRDRVRTYELEREQMWERRLFGNPHINASLKLTLHAVWFALPHNPGCEYLGVFVRVEMWRLAESIGVSTSTLTRQIKQLVSLGVIGRQEEDEKLENGQRRTRVWLALLEPAEWPEDIRPEVSKNGHGGVREKVVCEHCGSEALYLETRIVCEHCGQQNGPTKVTPLNPLPETPVPETVGRGVDVGPSHLDTVQPFYLVPETPTLGGAPGLEPATSEEDPFAADYKEERVNRPAVVLPVEPRPPWPDVPCFFCDGHFPWRWMPDKDNGWVCASCLSSLAMTVHNRALEKGWDNART